MSKMIMQLRILYAVCVLNLIENLNIEDACPTETSAT